MNRSGRIILVALALGALGALPVVAQPTLGLRGGVNIATFGGSDVPDEADSRTALIVGPYVTFPVAPNFGIQVGGMYTQKGVSFTDSDPDLGTVDATLKLDYIEFPVLLRVGIPTLGSISPHFMVGGAVSFELDCEVEGSGGGVTITVDCSAEPFEAEIKSVDFGGVAGAGLSFDTTGPLSITVDLLYNLGFTSIDDSPFEDDIKNRAFSIVAGVELGIG